MTKLEIRVVCVVNDYSDANNPIIHRVRDHTNKSGGTFEVRMYDYIRKEDDCQFITHLPAFHMYNKRAYLKTFYPNTKPLKEIDAVMKK